LVPAPAIADTPSEYQFKIDDLDLVQRASLAQGLLRRLVLGRVPAADRTAPREQGLEVLVSTPPAEDIPDLIEIIRQLLACKVEWSSMSSGSGSSIPLESSIPYEGEKAARSAF
jgi:hypothetical protein